MANDNLGADFFVRLRSDLLIIGDSILTDRHHASNGNYYPTDPQNQIGGFDDRPGKVMRRPIKFSPVRSAVD